MEKNKDIYVHYGSNRFERELFLMPMNRLDFVISKPFGGMWASNIESEYGWKDWCEDNEFRLDELQSNFRFTLSNEANVFHIKNAEDIRKLPLIDNPYAMTIHKVIDFEKCIQLGIDAIELHLSEDRSLYFDLYGWDCDSILILNPHIIEPL